MENSRGIESKLKCHVALNTGWSAEVKVLCFHSAIWFSGFITKMVHVRKSYLTDFCPSLFFQLHFLFPLGSYAGRAPSASTATGNKHHHNSEQEDLINQALD